MDVNKGRFRFWLLTGAFCLLPGCSFDQLTDIFNPKPAFDETSTESLVLGPDGLAPEKNTTALPKEVASAMAAAREHFRREEYDKAQAIYVWVANKDKNPPSAIQEAMYYRGECLRLTGYYPKAADVYSGLLNKFPNTPYREQCVQHLYDISNYWLDDTRAEMKAVKEKKISFWPTWFHWDKSKPFLDEQGWAIDKLEQVRLHDMNGPLADQALFMCGTVKMFNENYRDADQYFSQIPARHPESKLAPLATELAIKCKHLSTGGSDYDGRKTAEARKLIQQALARYPQLANDPEKRKFLERQIISINAQQAEKDYKIAEFYRRTGHPGAAYFYYELVRRRYPNTEYAKMASERWNSLREELDKDPSMTPNMPGKAAPAVAPNIAGDWQPPAGATPAGATPAPAPTPLPLPVIGGR
jgi:outer membrane protein assembly factor BamD (BamD/ComL family)